MLPQISDAPTSSLDRLVAELDHTLKVSYVGRLFPLSARLKPDTFAYLEAMALHSGISRNQIVNRLLDVGIDTTMKALPQDLVEKLNRRASEVLAASVKSDSGIDGSDE